jgi:ActR/RegA family two-component response regulator
MKRHPRRKRAAQARDLALANLGATNAADVQLDRRIDAHITRVLSAADGNLSLTADLLGVNRRTMQRYTKRKARKSRGRRRARKK